MNDDDDHHDFKHKHILTVFPTNLFLLSVIKFLAVEKTCSEGTLVAGIDKKSRAILARFGNCCAFCFHHSSGSSSPSI
jgi:hypothetical protein